MPQQVECGLALSVDTALFYKITELLHALSLVKIKVKQFVYPQSTKEFTRTRSELSMRSRIEFEFGNVGF